MVNAWLLQPESHFRPVIIQKMHIFQLHYTSYVLKVLTTTKVGSRNEEAWLHAILEGGQHAAARGSRVVGEMGGGGNAQWYLVVVGWH